MTGLPHYLCKSKYMFLGIISGKNVSEGSYFTDSSYDHKPKKLYWYQQL